ncbi:MAG: GNAT family N-acetyltransferase [Thiobacillus sp.]|nr:GNAT family N-acetyltransferase [Thiobacillus sp.]
MPSTVPMTDAGQRDRLARMLTRVFDRDPHFNWLVRQDERREEALFRLFRLLLGDLVEGQGEVHVAGDGKGVAIWYPPGTGRLPLWRQLAFLGAYLPICGWRAFPSRAIGLQVMETHRPRRPHYYLQVIGVLEGGRGHGRALMETVLRRCDEQGLPAFLETGNPENLGFYEKLGFRVLGSYGLPGGLRLWSLLREPCYPGRGVAAEADTP